MVQCGDGDGELAHRVQRAGARVDELLNKLGERSACRPVSTEGGDLLDFSSKVKAIISPRRGLVDLV